jgi:hypothetical protein
LTALPKPVDKALADKSKRYSQKTSRRFVLQGILLVGIAESALGVLIGPWLWIQVPPSPLKHLVIKCIEDLQFV